MNAAPWRTDPDLAGRFVTPEYPDELQVIIHDGEPQRTQRQAEICWVGVVGVHCAVRYGLATDDVFVPLVDCSSVRFAQRTVYRGKLLNQPLHLTHSSLGDEVAFLNAPGLPYPLQVRDDYLVERAEWVFVPCDQCGNEHGLDPPTVMARTRFPDRSPDDVLKAFTSFCSFCGRDGVMTIMARSGMAAAG